MSVRVMVVGLVFVTVWIPRAFGYIEAEMPLAEILRESTHVSVGKVESVDRGRSRAVAKMARNLKGRKEYDLVQMNLGTGARVQSRFLLELWERGDPMILYYRRHGGSIDAVAHAGNTWFQLRAGHHRDDRRVTWNFTHIEIYLVRTFNGLTPELIQLTDDVLAKRRRAPPVDRSVPKMDVRRLDPRAARARKRGGVSAPVVRKTLVPRQATWKYAKGNRAAPGSWRAASFNESGWTSGRAPFGYGDGPFGTTLRDMKRTGGQPGYTSVFLRRRFTVEDSKVVRSLDVTANYDDGFIVWVNGEKALAVNAPSGSPKHNSVASGNHESGSYELFSLDGARKLLVAGENVVAVQVFNVNATSTDLKFDMELGVAVERVSPYGRFRRLVAMSRAAGEPRGISWVDINGDEMLDIHFCRGQENVLLLNEGDGFTDRTRQYGLSRGSRSASWADYNGDDHPDLLTNNFTVFTHTGDSLRSNPKVLPNPATENSEGAGWLDYNGDGRPDVLITNGEHGIFLYENTGFGPAWFRDVSAKVGLGRAGLGKGNGNFVACTDYDADGYTDIVYNLGAGVFARNNEGRGFVADAKTGLQLAGSVYKRGLAFADFDNDDDLDVFVPAAGKPALYRYDGKFRNLIAKSGDLQASAGSFSCAWGDVNHDGLLDLFVCHTKGQSRLYFGDGKGSFRDMTGKIGLRGVPSVYAASFADIDDDGDLDLALNTERQLLVLENEIKKERGYAPLRVRVRARKGKIGAVVRVSDRRGKLLGFRELNGAEGCGGQAWPVAHVAVPVGRCTVAVVLSDGRFAEKKVAVGTRGDVVTVREAEFK